MFLQVYLVFAVFAETTFVSGNVIYRKSDDRELFDKPSVTISQGKIEGKKLDFEGTRVDRFLAIPYAEPPVGRLRLNPPEPHKGWGEDIFDASLDLNFKLKTKSCLQVSLQGSLTGSEDCLFLNVWVPEGVEESIKDSKPVMVWIHGGAFTTGNSWGANWLFDQEQISVFGDVVAVSLNYRLGPLGFISTGDDASPGNYGLLDQVMALRWVKNNIHAFGGDANRITIYGESAGAASVSYHMISPLSTNLFHRGISQSGTAFSSWGISRNPLRWAKKVANATGCLSEDNHAMIDCIRYADAETVLNAVTTFDTGSADNVVDMPWSGVIDNYFLPDTPDRLMINSANKDYIVGHNDMDGHLFACLDFPQINIGRIPMTLSDLSNAANLIAYDVPEQVSDATFFHYRPYTDDVPDDYYKKAVVAMYTDTLFASGTKLMAQFHSGMQETTGNTYMYLFSEPSKMPNGIYPSWMGADHADDLKYVFGKPYQTPGDFNDGDRLVSSAFMTYWTNFAWSGDPNIGPNNNVGPANWKTFELNTRNYLEINASLVQHGDLAVQSNYHPQTTAFWGKMIPQLWKSSYDLTKFNIEPETRLLNQNKL